MPIWAIVLDIAGLLALALVLVVVYLVVRRRLLARSGAGFELSNRVRAHRPGRGWVLGLGRYNDDALEWYRIFAVSMRPARSWRRSELAVVNRRPVQGAEELELYDDAVVVECRYHDDLVELAMTEPALTGLLAWLEAAPPGRNLRSR
jgi:Protein of unknown function (DUF2550)